MVMARAGEEDDGEDDYEGYGEDEEEPINGVNLYYEVI
jgi:hypothetical protein